MKVTTSKSVQICWLNIEGGGGVYENNYDLFMELEWPFVRLVQHQSTDSLPIKRTPPLNHHMAYILFNLGILVN